MNHVDIPALADKIRDHRFTGYTNSMLADEIDLFRSGQGIARLGDAVAALKEVATALAETDATLRTELGKLGVEWQGEAGAQAWTALSDKAGFSQEAGERIEESAERVFAQGEAFNRSLHRLPDSDALRVSVDGFGVGDFALSLVGFETDHVRRLENAMEAREQAIQVLDAYAADSGDNLVGTPELRAPEKLSAKVSPHVPESIDAGGGPGDVTVAAAASAPGTPGPAVSSAPSPSVPPAPNPVASPSAVTPPLGVPAQQGVSSGGRVGGPGGAPAPAPAGPSSTTPSFSPAPPVSGPVGTAPPAPGAGAGPRGTAGGPGGGQAGAPHSGGPGTPQGPGQPPSPGAPKGPGSPHSPNAPGSTTGVDRSVRAVGGTPAAPGAGAGPVGAVPHAGGGAKQAAQDQQLGRGASTGSVKPPALGAGPMSGAGAVGGMPRGGMSPTDVGGGIAAMGAGGVAGALAGEERRGRGVGRSSPGATRSPRQLPIGDLPEEEARVQRSSERLNPGGTSRHEPLLEKASPGEDDADDHIRRYGVDDADLFTDDRLVAPDVIGDDGSDGRR